MGASVIALIIDYFSQCFPRIPYLIFRLLLPLKPNLAQLFELFV